MLPGCVHVFMHPTGESPNLLAEYRRDSESGVPAMKCSEVRVEVIP